MGWVITGVSLAVIVWIIPPQGRISKSGMFLLTVYMYVAAIGLCFGILANVS